MQPLKGSNEAALTSNTDWRMPALNGPRQSEQVSFSNKMK